MAGMDDIAQRVNVAYYGAPRATQTPTAFGVPQANIEGKIDAGWLPDSIPISVIDPDELAGVPTVDVKTGRLALMKNEPTETHEVWELNDGDLATDEENGIVRPDDYDAQTNQRYWKRI